MVIFEWPHILDQGFSNLFCTTTPYCEGLFLATPQPNYVCVRHKLMENMHTRKQINGINKAICFFISSLKRKCSLFLLAYFFCNHQGQGSRLLYFVSEEKFALDIQTCSNTCNTLQDITVQYNKAGVLKPFWVTAPLYIICIFFTPSNQS